ncbi:Nuclear receptor corepressor 2 like [Actinidia chinensis var. chinensis]|uniref:Nuclear receptor corepressor 2 like n=1 Tax=Actinidia chinensis var. chinensis TaxID=1590841 RepID=A0A2R6R8K3_ACTCC|nr:Nuclear receptor corepressor 2 like [Actinidia chinensis var. chinensis]
MSMPICDNIFSIRFSAVGGLNSRYPRVICIPTKSGSQLISACYKSDEPKTNTPKSTTSVNISRNSIPKLGFKDKEKDQFDFETEKTDKESRFGIGVDNGTKASSRSGVKFINRSEKKKAGRLESEDLVTTEEGSDGVGSKLEELERSNGGLVREGRQWMNRSNMLAKQVISVQSALSLGFVSQLWVDAVSVGDVVLIQDESVMENEVKMVGLETLVGYNVVTPSRRSIGKVRGYTFNINSGAIESLELDSLGISIIPSSLVSTYALLVEDVLAVLSDTVVVHEAAASRIQRLTKGFWDSQRLRNSIDELGQHFEHGRPSVEFDEGQSRRKSFHKRKSHQTPRETVDDWDLPMDYF